MYWRQMSMLSISDPPWRTAGLWGPGRRSRACTAATGRCCWAGCCCRWWTATRCGRRRSATPCGSGRWGGTASGTLRTQNSSSDTGPAGPGGPGAELSRGVMGDPGHTPPGQCEALHSCRSGLRSTQLLGSRMHDPRGGHKMQCRYKVNTDGMN